MPVPCFRGGPPPRGPVASYVKGVLPASMTTVILVDAAPGFEDSVEVSLGDLEEVSSVVRENVRNHDLAALLDIEDPAELQRFLTNEVRTLGGLQGYKQVDEPDPDLLARLEA